MAFLNETGLKRALQGLWDDVKTYISNLDLGVSWSDIEDKPDVALKSDLTTVYRFKGSVATVDDLPIFGMEVGDVWDVANGMNYAWDGEYWDALGMNLTIEPISDETIDSIIQEVTGDAVSE